MLKNNLLPKIAFLLPKKENLPMHLVQIISFIFMIAIFDSHGFTDSDTSFLIAEPIRENQKLGTWWGIGCPLIFKGLYLINHNLITFNSLFKIQTVFYVFFLGKICLILFKNKNIKLSVFLFLITFYSPFLFLHILLGFSLLFILDFTLRINKSYSSSTLINNDILTIITLGGNIRDKDINYYAHKYIDKIGGINGKSEEIYYGTKSIKDFD